MNPEDLKKILDALSAADVREFQLKTGSFDLSLQRGPVSAPCTTQQPIPAVQSIQPIQQVPLPPLPPVAPIAPVAPVSAALPAATVPVQQPMQAVETSTATEPPHTAPAAATVAEVKETASTETTTESASGTSDNTSNNTSSTAGTPGTPVKAPIVGTFYAASSPDAAPYVKVGDQVSAGQILCIIEAMKLMNEIEAETSGVIKEILISNAEPVEYGQTLFIIE